MVKEANSKESIVNSNKRTIKNFTNLDAWRVSHQVTISIYNLTKKFPRQELFGLTSQLRRAASSTTANIAEGWGRYHFADKIRFYYQARGSSSEVQNFLILAKDLKYCTQEDFQKTMQVVMDSFRLINGLIRSIEKQK